MVDACISSLFVAFLLLRHREIHPRKIVGGGGGGGEPLMNSQESKQYSLALSIYQYSCQSFAGARSNSFWGEGGGRIGGLRMCHPPYQPH